ncbi:TraR/DksA C4-type zinc finger protein [Sulfurimonas sp. HSL3-7]|uniref:TraR/DksA family transcriptional regulator n=1 Tax=Sulfonitrofixus jiaomeiensis TaxID=3131938 RepID=UPI0031F9249E
MTRSERHLLRERITSDLESLDKELKALELQLRPIAPDCSLGDLLRCEMMHDQEVLNRAYMEAKKRYSRLLYAKEHLEDEKYGICIECEEPIAFQRVLLIPESSYCVNCAKENNL